MQQEARKQCKKMHTKENVLNINDRSEEHEARFLHHIAFILFPSLFILQVKNTTGY